MVPPFPLSNDLELVSDNAASHTAAIPAEISEIPALCRFRMSFRRTSRKHDGARRTRRHQPPGAVKPATFPLCNDRWESSPTVAQAKYLTIARPRRLLRSAPALDLSPRRPHRSDSYDSADDICESSILTDVLGEAIQLADDLNERFAPRRLSSDEDKVEVVARTG